MSFSQGGTSYTSVSGARATSNVGSSVAIREVQEAMITYEPYQKPILTWLLSKKFGKAPTGNPKFEWMYSTWLPQRDTVTISGGATSEDNITVGDSTLYQVGTKFVVEETGEVCIVDSIASSQIDITKVGSGNITAVTSGTIKFLGDSFEQGSNSATAKSVNKEFAYNYVEIFKKAVEETESQQSNVEYGPVDYMRNKMDRMGEFLLDIEKNLLHGIRSTFTGVQNGSYTQHATGGLFDTTSAFIYTYYNFSGSTPDEAWFFNTFLKTLYAKGTNRKRMYCGANLLQAINDFSKIKQITHVTESEYGVNITKINHPFGTLELAWHPMLDGDVFANYGIALDIGVGNVIRYRYKAGNGKNRDLQFRDYGEYYKQSDTRKGEWLGEIGFEIQGNEYHGIVKPA